MMEKWSSRYRTVEFIATIMLCLAAYIYESIHFPRSIFFLGGYTLFLAFILIRHRMDKKLTSRVLVLTTYLVSILLVIFLESTSRYIINYFIHMLYILLMIELSMTLKNIKDLWIGALIIMAGMYKYIVLVMYKPVISTYAELVFFLLLNAMSLIVIVLMQNVRDERRKLEQANIKLQSYSDQVEALTEIETRNTIASEIHDSLGHNLTALIMQLEMTSHLLSTDPENAKNLLNEAKDTARNNLVAVRKAVKAMDQASEVHDIERLIRDFSIKTGVQISWEIDQNCLRTFDEKKCIYRAIQETMTNAVRHGEATELNITLKCYDRILLSVKDNGNTQAVVEFGYGLSKLKDRFEGLGGEISVILNDGFEFKGYLPVIHTDFSGGK